MPVVRESYEVLAAQYDVIVLEGAGSPAEIILNITIFRICAWRRWRMQRVC
jgi:cobyric acid synthase